ncbi:amylo-alpha-1,6-glucosidase [Desulfococcaceae bacterium HSG9]|nr:amylo-alpha-1,6-glucosidase [Desulfococcaceae bacterium HSG9]
MSFTILQKPSPGTSFLMHRGDTLTFTLSLDKPIVGYAFLRTNAGHASTTRQEIIQQVRRHENPLGQGWFDVPMQRLDERRFQIKLPLGDVGHFQAKTFFIEKDAIDPVWPSGPNTVINIEPACTCCANIIYNAFVRQFGPNKSGHGTPDDMSSQNIHTLDSAGYTVIPPSGTFRNLIEQLDFIIGVLGCRWIQLLPIHPTPTTYARMGRFGSPYAALSFTAIDPALAEFDPRATPLEQFIELVDAAHARNARIIIDIAINHTGWAAGLHESHPEWLKREDDGRIKVPGAWGVVWADLTALDYTHETLWEYMADVFLTWCRRGVDGFRCDAGYMIPVKAWKYIIACVREQYPDTLFLLEGLGGKISVTEELLDSANFNWAYSELFQNYNRSEIEFYIPEPVRISQTKGLTVHFAETHDNNRLAAVSIAYARMRTALCALLSSQGGFAFTNGVEWHADEKINVHDACSLNWGAEINQIDPIRRLNTLLKEHPAFFDRTRLTLVTKGEGNQIVVLRHHLPSGKKLLIAANLDQNIENIAQWNTQLVNMRAPLTDLLTGKTVTVHTDGDLTQCPLMPLQIVSLSDNPNDIERLNHKLPRMNPSNAFGLPDRIIQQCLRAKVIDLWRYYHGLEFPQEFNQAQAIKELAANPLEFCRHNNPFNQEPRVITWRWPQDVQREVMLPPGHFLLIYAPAPFRAAISIEERTLANEESLPANFSLNRRYFALFTPLKTPDAHQDYTLNLTIYEPNGSQRIQAPLLGLTRFENTGARRFWSGDQLRKHPRLFLSTNGKGGMLRAALSWGALPSRYDALLAANLNPDYPEDRRILFTRCRAWIVYQDFSQEIRHDCLDAFSSDYHNKGALRHKIPCGRGEHIFITIGLEMAARTNAMRIQFYRHPAQKNLGGLADHKPVRLILRPDIDDRSFHAATKAYTGPEHAFPNAVAHKSDSFTFTPHPERRLHVNVPGSNFVWEPEWHYMVHHPAEALRGLDSHTDLFSPGYFTVPLSGTQTVALTAQSDLSTVPKLPENIFSDWQPQILFDDQRDLPLDEALLQALDHYVVKRGKLKTVIAGYPWFLDWGRDALIFTRGLIAAGHFNDARAILKQFGRFEQDGALPNMIHGDNAANRDTSDAQLWFCVACRELIHAEKSDSFLNETCGRRTVRDVLLSMGDSLTHGTANGIFMDADSGLLFSPGHFTWMDTNFPAGTLREGYPIEIQALWQYTLDFLAEIAPPKDCDSWKRQARKVRASIVELFWLEQDGFLADCLHAPPGTPARQAQKDDALRSNQLLAITLGAVKDRTLCRLILAACEELLIPGAIRSLADRPVRYPCPVSHNGHILNDPHHPYQGKYEGDEDTQRKPAYHNGTAWTWPFPSYCEAWVLTYGKTSIDTALAWLGSSSRIINQGCAGHTPEILDGNYPHTARGCDAQAWGASELLRVLLQVKKAEVVHSE